MKDCMGKEIVVGDTIVFTLHGYSDLKKGIVCKINPKTLSVARELKDGVYQRDLVVRYSDQVAKVTVDANV